MQLIPDNFDFEKEPKCLTMDQREAESARARLRPWIDEIVDLSAINNRDSYISGLKCRNRFYQCQIDDCRYIYHINRNVSGDFGDRCPNCSWRAGFLRGHDGDFSYHYSPVGQPQRPAKFVHEVTIDDVNIYALNPSQDYLFELSGEDRSGCLAIGKFITITETATDNGTDLIIRPKTTLTAMVSEFERLKADHPDRPEKMILNGITSLTLGSADDLGCLSEATVICETGSDRAWYYPHYQIASFADDLLHGETVRFAPVPVQTELFD